MIPNPHPLDLQTARHGAQWKALQREQQFRALIEQTSDWIWEVDRELRYVYASPKVYDLLGYTPEEVLGRTPFDFMPLEEALRMREMIDRVMRHPEPFQAVENRNIHRDGTLRTLETSGVPILDARGQLTGLRGIDRDITERKKVEEALQAALARSAQEKARSEAIIAAIGEGLVIVDREFRILYQNQILVELVGNAQGRHCYLAMAQCPTICENCPVAQTFQDGEIHTVEKAEVREGRTVYRELTASPLRDESGQIVAGIELVRDITERKLAEQAIKESERQMREVQRIGQLGSWQYDYETGKLVWSDEIYRILGLSPQEVHPAHQIFLDTVHPEDREMVADRYHRSLEFPCEGYETEHRIVRKNDGAVRYLHQKCEHLRNQAGRVVRSYGMVHDITSHKKAEQRIKALNADLSARALELERANKELEAFSYTVSHDLRGPLTNISSYCQAIAELAGGHLDDQCRSFLESVLQEIEGMDGLITSLLNLSRFAHVKLHTTRFDLSDIVRAIAAELQMHHPQRQVSFDIEEGLMVSGDEKLLRVALNNLVGNAWKFSAGKEHPVIRFGMKRVQGKRVYYLRDNGIGFEMQQSDKIFAVFKRLHPSEEFEGFGVGLTTVQTIIERHRGRIWAEGEPGRGATFFFTLHERTAPIKGATGQTMLGAGAL
ncbi:PAS domain-containing sensor histidine kinase [Geomonas limicola]|uniref:histidine kinase n=1 Tax=Geomonas limicola TaxID=2740186 RepID=A0A6V8N8Q4_9BACT|nr:PAS domain S-box protein [Geomonas limicola]GFO68962.1 PAS domain-containing sensor histidine kinase [Geomonas limicola]